MKLSSLQRRFLAAATLDAEQNLQATARRLRTKAPPLRYAVNDLIEQKVVQIAPMINRMALGLTDYHVFFSVAVQSGRARDALIKDLCTVPGVMFFAEVGGDFQYEMIIAAPNAFMAASLLDRSTSLHNVRLQQKAIASGIDFRLYGKRYLQDERSPAKPAFIEPHREPSTPIMPLDDLDKALLRLLSDKGSISHRELGRMLSLSHTAIRYRIERLKAQGVLRGFYYDVEPLMYGYQDFVFQLAANTNSEALRRKLFTVADAHPNVSYAASYFGAWDYELGIEVMPAEQVVIVTQELSEQLGPDFSPIRLLMRFRQLRLTPCPL